MESKRFQKNVENFTCEHCHADVTGNGYTNHCPKCLWSRHVDNNPGDREAVCRGMMEPVALSLKDGEYIITHRCTLCGAEKNNRLQTGDSFEAVLELSKRLKS